MPAEYLNKLEAQQQSKSSTSLPLRSLVSQMFYSSYEGGHIANNSIAYIRIPKAASTSVGSAVLNSIYPNLEQEKLDSTQRNFLIDANLQYSIDPSLKYFTIVRNPFARLVSVYKDFFERTTDYFIYDDYLMGIFRRTMSFNEFVERLRHVPDPAKDQHLIPQHKFVAHYSKQEVKPLVFKLEEFEQLNSFLSAHQLGMPAFNVSEQYDYREYYTPQSLRTAAKIYARDFEQFNY